MTENAPIWLDPGHGKYVLCSVMSVSYRSPEFSSTFHDNVIISPSSFWQAQGDLMKRIWQTEISCAAHDDDTRLDCGDHMWSGERSQGPDDDTEPRTIWWPGRAKEREREESVWREICSRVPRLVSCVPALGTQPDQHHWLLLPVTGGAEWGAHTWLTSTYSDVLSTYTALSTTKRWSNIVPCKCSIKTS